MRHILAVGLALAVALVLVSVAAGGGGATFADPTEGTAGSADIQSVSVTNNPSSHTITFSVQLSNMPELTEDNAAVEIYVDADKNAATGGNGLECVIGVSDKGWYFVGWDGTKFSQVTGLGLFVTYKDGLFTTVMPVGACNLSSAIAFWVSSYRGPDLDNPVEDDAPDTGVYDYTLSTAAPAVKTSALAVTAAPHSGQQFMVTAFEVDFTDGTFTDVYGLTCTAMLAGRKLPGSGTGGCAFAVPKKSHGKKLVVTATGKASSGQKYRTRSTYVVR
jgi:hypothetical protein